MCADIGGKHIRILLQGRQRLTVGQGGGVDLDNDERPQRPSSEEISSGGQCGNADGGKETVAKATLP